MGFRKKCATVLLLIAACVFIRGQIREIDVPDLNDIAMAGFDSQGNPVIYVNRNIVRILGPLIWEFVRSHEYGHFALNHIKREDFIGNPYNRTWIRQSFEREADCYAAQKVSPLARKAVIDFFIKMQGPNRPDWYHPTGYERAEVINKCGQESIFQPSNRLSYPPFHQPFYQPRMSFVGGIGLTNISGLDQAGAWGLSGAANNTLGFELGFNWYLFYFSEGFSISTGFYYAQFGSNLSTNHGDISISYEEFYIPLLIHFVWRAGGNTYLEVSMGMYYSPEYAIPISAEYKYELNENWDTLDNFAQNDFGLILGSSLVFRVNAYIALSLGFKYQFGLTNLDLEDGYDISPKRTQYFGILLGCRLDFNL